MYPDGNVKMYQNADTTGEKLVADGVSDALSFGPILVQDSAVTKRSSAYGEVDNPRTAFGFVEKGHYICVLLEGRMKNTYSKGSSCIWMANTMQHLGCVSAINLDGGQTAAMMFMGKRPTVTVRRTKCSESAILSNPGGLMMNRPFAPAAFLLPSPETDLTRFSVVACDQYTSEPEIWRRMDRFVGSAPSALRLILPEAFLSEAESRIPAIHRAMADYLSRGLLKAPFAG